jgi:hypothetical protein
VIDEGGTYSSGEVPYTLAIVLPNSEIIEIDVEEYQWATKYAHLMRVRSRWYLIRKSDGQPVLGVDVMDGDQPYYAAEHIVRAQGRNAGAHIVCYGIGAKRADGHTDRMWVLPNGIICSGNDVYSLGDAILG